MRVYCRKASETNTKKWNINLPGSVHMFILSVLMVVFVTGGGYIYSVNRNAVQGYQLRTLEKEMNILRDENAKLRIAEMDLRSLGRIETAEETLRMQKIDTAVYLEEYNHNDSQSSRPVALK